jgi:hypothetical protein
MRRARRTVPKSPQRMLNVLSADEVADDCYFGPSGNWGRSKLDREANHEVDRHGRSSAGKMAKAGPKLGEDALITWRWRRLIKAVPCLSAASWAFDFKLTCQNIQSLGHAIVKRRYAHLDMPLIRARGKWFRVSGPMTSMSPRSWQLLLPGSRKANSAARACLAVPQLAACHTMSWVGGGCGDPR